MRDGTTRVRSPRKRGKSLTFDEVMIDWLEDQAEARGWTVSEFARTVFSCYREDEVEFERLHPGLKVSRREDAA